MMANERAWPRVLGLLGLGLRARTAVVGVAQVRAAARRERLELALVAADASRHSLEKVVPLLRARRIEVLSAPSAAQLGRAVGRDAAAAVGIVDRELARGILALVGSGSVGQTGGQA